MNDCRVSCIIPAYNEGPRIGHVLSVVFFSRFVDEIIVVNDASTDDTDYFIEQFLCEYPAAAEKLSYSVHSENKGKGGAITTGLALAGGSTILMLDADLNRLRTECVDQMVVPVLDGKVDMTITSLTRFLYTRVTNIDPLSGMRCLRREILDAIDCADTGFSIENQINEYVLKQRIPFIPLLDDYSRYVTKSEKYGFVEGIRRDHFMHREIRTHVGFSKFVFLSIGMFYYATKFKYEFLV
jgi:glycosyltransferase involved in cell wall biosynthesis